MGEAIAPGKDGEGRRFWRCPWCGASYKSEGHEFASIYLSLIGESLRLKTRSLPPTFCEAVPMQAWPQNPYWVREDTCLDPSFGHRIG